MKEKEFGDFEDISEETSDLKKNNDPNIPVRVRMPRGKELIGKIIQRLGGNRMDVKATDGKVRNCRVPGRFKRTLWLRPKDFVLIVPDEFNDKKGDVIYKYRPAEINHIERKGMLSSLKDEF